MKLLSEIYFFGKSKYLVYSNGTIYSYNKNKFLNIQDNGNGYKYVSLSSGSISKSVAVHRLVAKVFIPNPDNLPQVNHKDLDKSNNNLSNLEWVSIKENLNHARKNNAFINLEIKVKDNHLSWIGQKMGNRTILRVLEEKSKSSNYKVEVECICGHIFSMYYNDFKKNKTKNCVKCKHSKD